MKTIYAVLFVLSLVTTLASRNAEAQQIQFSDKNDSAVDGFIKVRLTDMTKIGFNDAGIIVGRVSWDGSPRLVLNEMTGELIYLNSEKTKVISQSMPRTRAVFLEAALMTATQECPIEISIRVVSREIVDISNLCSKLNSENKLK